MIKRNRKKTKSLPLETEDTKYASYINLKAFQIWSFLMLL